MDEYEKIKQEIQKLKKEVETEANEKVKSQNGGDENPAPWALAPAPNAFNLYAPPGRGYR